MKNILMIMIAISFAISWTTTAIGQTLNDNATTIYLVRHAEKAADGTADPKLSKAGKNRAMALIYTLQEDTLNAVFSTNTIRTLSTGIPIADYNAIDIQRYNPKDHETFLEKILTLYKGKTVLIVGHSNTVPKMLNLLLGNNRYKQFKENQYNDLFMVQSKGLGESDVHHFKYGKMTQRPLLYNVEEDKVAVQGYDVVSYFEDDKAEEGTTFFWTTHDGLRYYFATKQHLNTFIENPMKYLPQYGGWCAYGMSLDKQKDGYAPNKFPIDPEQFTIINGKLYLFYNAGGHDTLKLWKKNEGTRLRRSQAFWKKIVKQSK